MKSGNNPNEIQKNIKSRRLFFRGEQMKNAPILAAVALAVLLAGCTSTGVTMEQSRGIAEQFIIQDETYAFDGLQGTLEFENYTVMKCPYCWSFTFRFDCGHLGYGNRSGQVLAQVLTPHTAEITVSEGKVVSAVLDGRWNMLTEEPVGKGVVQVSYSTGGGLTPVPWNDTITVTSDGRLVRERWWGGNHTVRELNLSPLEFQAFTGIVSGADVFSFQDEYRCAEMCPTDAPGAWVKFIVNGKEKQVFLYSPEALPAKLEQILHAMQDFRKRFGAGIGEFCGGIGGIPCEPGLKCEIEGDYPDAGGTCVN